MAVSGTSESFMHHPANDRCWPKVAAHDYATGVCFGHLAVIDLQFLNGSFLVSRHSNYLD